MSVRSRQRGQIMLIILGTLFLGAGAATGVFTSGKSIESIRKEVGRMQLGATRRDRVFGLLDQWEAIAEPAHRGFDEYGKALLDLVTRQDATAADFQSVLKRQRDELKQSEGQLLPVREALRGTLDEDEWRRLFQ
jgi:hypothetical protein